MPTQNNTLLSKRAISFLRKTQKAILKTPASYNQDFDNGWTERPTCNSPSCIIGWLRHFAKGTNLGLTDEQFSRLYYADRWPRKFYRGNLDGWHKIKASTAAKRIEHFIQTDGEK